MNIEIYLQIFACKMFEHSKLAFKLQVFLYLLTSFISFIILVLFNKFASIWKVHSSSTE